MKQFEELIAPHLDAAYNLARWLTGNDSAARDVVQESALRAFRFLQRFADGNARAWFLAIVRNESYTWLKASAGRHWVAIEDDIGEHEGALSHSQTRNCWPFTPKTSRCSSKPSAPCRQRIAR